MSNPTPPDTPTPTKSPPNRLALLEARLRAPHDNPPNPHHSNSSSASPSHNQPSASIVEDEDEVRSFSSDGSTSQQRLSLNMRRKYAPKSRTTPPSNMRKRRRPTTSTSGMKTARVDSFFKPISKEDAVMTPSTPKKAAVAKEDSRDVGFGGGDSYRYFRERVDELMRENDRLKGLEKEMEALKMENEDLRTRVEIEVVDLKTQLEEKNVEVERERERGERLAEVARDVLVELAEKGRRERRDQVLMDGERLGRIVVERSGTSFHEAWEDGQEWKSVEQQLENVQRERETLERKRKEMVKRKNALSNGAGSGDRGEMPPPRNASVWEESADYFAEQEDIYKVRLGLLKKEENSLQEKKVNLVRERDVMVRELRRQNDEKLSAFSGFPTLNDRYVLLNLLGRGGFSEVFKAFDLKGVGNVACKIHQLASNWSEQKKKSFIRHAWREYKIHKSLKHPRVVRLVDIFEIDENSFCTVLEYCEGCDLDSHLRVNKVLPEKEARSIISQVFSGLKYLAEQKKRIIHYDLKPGNILLHKGEVQITDFGLSKVMSETESTMEGMELTSQGAGTMWYLPPECFETGQAARISVKVDVWSAGVILFQMLYGRKPFGHNQTQEKMFREKTVQHQELEFPTKPSVSEAGKDFMRKCLTRRASLRPDVREALQHPFLKK